MAESPLHRHEEWKTETAELHSLLATAQQRLSVSPRSTAPSARSSQMHAGNIGTPIREEMGGLGAGLLGPGSVSPVASEGVPDIVDVGVPASTLQQDMKAALDLSELCDVVLVADDGEVCGIRAVLACRSAHFREMLQTAGGTEKITVEGVSSKALAAVVAYLVTDEVDDAVATDWFVQVEVLSLAQKWAINRLESIVRRNIGQVLTTENVVGLLIECTRFELEELGSYCVNYVVRHKDGVRQKGNWQTLTQHPEILLRVSLSL